MNMDQSAKSSSDTQAPSTADMIHEIFCKEKNASTWSLARPELDRLQMSWEADVEDVYPIIGTTSFTFMKEFPNPHKRVYITSVADAETLVAALKTACESWPVHRSIAVEYDPSTRLLVVLRATQRYFDRAISTHADVENEQALTEIAMSGNHAASELPQGLMLRMVIAKLKSTNTMGLVTLFNHSIYDAVSVKSWAKDMKALIMGSTIARRIPHKAFAEAYYLYQTSLAAKMATDYHLKRLRGIGSMRNALWPPS